MTKEEKYILAKWAMQHAIDSGAQQASVTIAESKSSNVDVREEKIDTLKEAIQSSMTIRLYVDGRYAVQRTNRLNKEELARFIEQGVAGTRFLAEDKFRTLPDPKLYYNGGGSELKTVDGSYDRIEPETKVKLAFDAEKEILNKDERILSITASYSDRISSRIMVTSNGFEGDTQSSTFNLAASVSVDGGDARPGDDWRESAVFFDQLKKDEIGSKALSRALKKIGQEKIKSGKYKMIIENLSVSRIFYPLLSALDGYNIQQKNSFLIDKLGKQIASKKLSLTDDPFIIGGRGSQLNLAIK